MIYRVEIVIALWAMVVLCAGVHANEYMHERLGVESSGLECQFCDTYQFVSPDDVKSILLANETWLLQREGSEDVKQIIRRVFLARAPPGVHVFNQHPIEIEI